MAMDSIKAGWKGFSQAVGRTTHKVMAKMGKAEVTLDPEYEQDREQLLEDHKKLKRFVILLEKTLELLTSVRVVQSEIATDLQLMYGTTGSISLEIQSNIAASEQFELARATVDETFRRQLIVPLQEYLTQYKDMKVRMSELTTRRTDMDRFAAKLNDKMQKQGSQTGIGEAETKYKTAKAAYEILLTELKIDLPKLHSDLAPYLEPLFAIYAKTLNTFFTRCSASSQTAVTPNIERVNCSAVLGYPSVITPAEKSSAGVRATREREDSNSGTVTSSTTTSTSTTVTAATAATTSAAAPSVVVPDKPPAKPLPTPGATSGPAKALAMYTFQAEDDTEVPFRKGDTIAVFKQEGEWWEGEVGGRRGLFPANYVKLL